MAGKSFLLLLLLAVVFLHAGIGVEASLDHSIVGYAPEDLNSEEQLLNLFESWLHKHEKSYESVLEMHHRFTIFKDNLRYINSHNMQQKTSYWLVGVEQSRRPYVRRIQGSLFWHCASPRKEAAQD
jgi:xylem cysteine proteinase